jgi:2-dehydro-3-deoxygluconokinase
MDMTDIVTFGETMLRLSPPDETRLETADQYDVAAAGAESNVAVTTQRLGLDAAWISKLPDSPVGRKVAGDLRRHNVTVDVAWDDSPECRQGTYYLERGQKPRGNTVVYDRARASATTATPEELPTDLLEHADCFHTTGITPALSDTTRKTTKKLLSQAQTAGTTTSFDVNYRSKLWDQATARETIADLLPDVDVLVVAKRDAESVLEVAGNAESVARSLYDTYDFEVTVVTRGSDGALAYTGDTVFEQPTYESTNAYPIGTGDSFVGGFLSQYLTGQSVSDALSWGAGTAALKRSIPGDMAVVTPTDVQRVIEGDTASISR